MAEPKSGNVTRRYLLGDWYCPTDGCHMHNFAKRTTCFRCRNERPIETDADNDENSSENNSNGFKQAADVDRRYALPPGQRLRRGDWHCPNNDCHAVNFASRDECFDCAAEKPPQPNEWQCGQCGFCNLDFRSACLKCTFKNPNGPKLREGDWCCNKCKHINFARRTDCQQCTSLKER